MRFIFNQAGFSKQSLSPASKCTAGDLGKPNTADGAEMRRASEHADDFRNLTNSVSQAIISPP